ncbi:MAG: HEPN domain-containing protein [Cyanobacteria bacterium MAG CAR3_bin_5]|nr:HEPN domain-containing protein [Cyanobacteria bacterium MAG CAR3_bin_5]
MIIEQNHQSTDSILSNARKNFEESKQEIEHLLEIHMEMEGGQSGRPGRRPEQIQVLHRAAIVMITACWQAYVEDLFRENFERLLNSFDNPKKIPDAIKEDIYNNRNDTGHVREREYVWEFAGNGWKEIILEEWKNKKLDNFNTPSNKKVDSLFKYLGLRNISARWCWEGINSERVIEKLNKYLTIRHKIVHGQKDDRNYNLKPNKNNVREYLNHVEKLIEKTETMVKNHVEKLIGQDVDKNRKTASRMGRPGQGNGGSHGCQPNPNLCYTSCHVQSGSRNHDGQANSSAGG